MSLWETACDDRRFPNSQNVSQILALRGESIYEVLKHFMLSSDCIGSINEALISEPFQAKSEVGLVPLVVLIRSLLVHNLARLQAAIRSSVTLQPWRRGVIRLLWLCFQVRLADEQAMPYLPQIER